MILLDVPFSEKDSAKSVGARWNPQAKKWYVPEDLSADLTPFQRWLPDSSVSTLPLETDSHAFAFDPTAANEAEKGVPLSHLMHQVQRALRQSFAGAVWVKAEVANLNERRGHWYFELTETTSEGQQLATCRAMIWQSQAERLLSKFSNETGSELSAGQKVLLLAEVTFHEKFGFSLVIQDIDPSFTLGELEANVQAIRKRLITEKIYELNKRFSLPSDFFRLAVLAPPNAAGLGDFRADAKLLENAGLCEFKYFYSSFQGDRVEEEFVAALDAFEALHSARAFDALIIIRGGGAKLDLHPLNNYTLVKLIAERDLPVLTGIGHERDSTLVDEVAAVKFDTPSKVIAGIRQAIVEAAQQAKQNWLFIEKASHLLVHRHKEALTTTHQALLKDSQTLLHQQKQTLLPVMVRIEQAGFRLLSHQKQQSSQWLQAIELHAKNRINLDHSELKAAFKIITEQAPNQLRRAQISVKSMIGLILGAGPETQLNRGFAMVKTPEGRPISSAQDAVTQLSFQIHFHDGILDAKPLTMVTDKKDET